jgi:hypothetical protein
MTYEWRLGCIANGDLIRHGKIQLDPKAEVKEQNVKNSKVGQRGSGLYDEWPNGRRIDRRVGSAT